MRLLGVSEQQVHDAPADVAQIGSAAGQQRMIQRAQSLRLRLVGRAPGERCGSALPDFLRRPIEQLGMMNRMFQEMDRFWDEAKLGELEAKDRG